jgi:predicted transcriptional regulator
MSSVKEEYIQLIRSLPDTVTWDDILYEMYVKLKIRRGMQDIEEGRTYSHEEVMKRFGILNG